MLRRTSIVAGLFMLVLVTAKQVERGPMCDVANDCYEEKDNVFCVLVPWTPDAEISQDQADEDFGGLYPRCVQCRNLLDCQPGEFCVSADFDAEPYGEAFVGQCLPFKEPIGATCSPYIDENDVILNENEKLFCGYVTAYVSEGSAAAGNGIEGAIKDIQWEGQCVDKKCAQCQVGQAAGNFRCYSLGAGRAGEIRTARNPEGSVLGINQTAPSGLLLFIAFLAIAVDSLLVYFVCCSSKSLGRGPKAPKAPKEAAATDSSAGPGAVPAGAGPGTGGAPGAGGGGGGGGGRPKSEPMPEHRPAPKLVVDEQDGGSPAGAGKPFTPIVPAVTKERTASTASSAAGTHKSYAEPPPAFDDDDDEDNDFAASETDGGRSRATSTASANGGKKAPPPAPPKKTADSVPPSYADSVIGDGDGNDSKRASTDSTASATKPAKAAPPPKPVPKQPPMLARAASTASGGNSRDSTGTDNGEWD